MAKQPDLPDDNDLAQAGRFGGYSEGQEPVEPDDACEDGPRSSARPARPPLRTAVEASEDIARTLDLPADLVVLRSSAGAGKSEQMRRSLVRHVDRDERAVVVVPTHALAEQTVTGLHKLGAGSEAPMGVARHRLKVLNEHGEVTEVATCKYVDAADGLTKAGVHARQTLCVECSHRDAYDGNEGSECPAYLAGQGGSPIVVLQQPVLASALAANTKALLLPGKPERAEDKPATLVVVDEMPPLFTHTDLAGAWRDYRAVAGDLTEEARMALEPLLAAVLRGAKGAAAGATLRELAVRGEVQDVDTALADACTLDGEDLWGPKLPAHLARLAIERAGEAFVDARIKHLARVTELCAAIIDAAHHPDRPVLYFDEKGGLRLVTRARWTRRVLPYLAAGGRVRILDATAPLDALRALFGDRLVAVQVDVEDAPGLVERRHVQWQRGAKGRHVVNGQPDHDRLRGPLRDIATTTAGRDARVLAVLTDLPTADALRAWLKDRAFYAAHQDVPGPASTLVPAELAAFVAGGGELQIGHYGAQRGLDRWADASVLVTLGDSWPNLGAARAEALSLGLDPDGWARELARAELLQAWGRSRSVHRTTPVLVMHVGARALAPEPSWAPQWATAPSVTRRRGAPTSAPPPSDPATWKADAAARGLSHRQHAAALGVAWTTYRRLATEALQRRPVEARPAPNDAPSERAKNGSPEVGHKWAIDVSGYGSSGGPSPSSLIAICGPPETPADPPIAEVAVDPEASEVTPAPSTDRKRVRFALVPPPVEAAPLAPDAPPSTAGPASPRSAAAKVKGDAA